MTMNGEKLTAWIDRSGTKSQVAIEVALWVYTRDYEIRIEKAEPQGIVSTTLLVDVAVEERMSPMKGVLQTATRRFVLSADWTTVEARISYQGDAGGRATHLTATIKTDATS